VPIKVGSGTETAQFFLSLFSTHRTTAVSYQLGFCLRPWAIINRTTHPHLFQYKQAMSLSLSFHDVYSLSSLSCLLSQVGVAHRF